MRPIVATAVALAALAACKNKSSVRDDRPSSPVAPGAPVKAAVQDAAPPLPSWELHSAPIELACGAEPEVPGGYRDALAAGRAAATSRHWGLAVAAFEKALTSRAGDAVALDELSLALLRAGDLDAALAAGERASAAATAPNAMAAALYNAGRAAEALGDPARAKAHFEQSLELRPNDVVRAQLAKLAPVVPRSVAKGPVMSACSGQPSVAAACTCLATLPSLWGEGTVLDGPGTCEPLAQHGEAAALVQITSAPADVDVRRPGTAIVLLAKRGATWSAVRTIEVAPELDAEDSPNGTNVAEVMAYEERPVPGGALVWVQSQRRFSETSAGENEVNGSASLTVCELPRSSARAPSCDAPVTLGTWSHAYAIFEEDDAHERCTVFTPAVTYRATLTSRGVLSIVLVNGVDEQALAGRYQR
jgi:tetratricopeptide (TPR) repeat protein